MFTAILAKAVTTAMIIASPMFQGQFINMNHALEQHNFKATSFGEYIEVYNNEVVYDTAIDMSFATMVRYYQAGKGKDQAYPWLDQIRHLNGKRTAQDFLDDQEVLGYVTKIK